MNTMSQVQTNPSSAIVPATSSPLPAEVWVIVIPMLVTIFAKVIFGGRDRK